MPTIPEGDDVVPQPRPPGRSLLDNFHLSPYTYLDDIAQGQFRRGVTTGQTYAQFLTAAQRRAIRATEQVTRTMASIPLPPWLRREGKRGALYTLADVQQNILRSNKAINDAKAKAKDKVRKNVLAQSEEKFLQRLGRFARRGFAGRVVAGRQGFDVGNPFAEAVTEVWLGRVLDADAARKRLSTATNRRGATSTRSVSARATPGRTGALATRPLASPTGAGVGTTAARTSATGARTSTGTAAGTGNGTTGQLSTRSDTVVRESTASREARRVMEETRTLPRTASRTATQTQSLLRFTTNLARPLLSSMGVRAAPRQSSRQAVRRSPPRVRPSTSTPTLLTPLNSVGVGYGTQTMQQKCDCPKPKKRKSSSSCRNPIVSRTVRDGIITTKRKQQCQPFRPSAP